jgi:cellobiose phosphorylase
MFFERERAIRPGDSHGDIVFWPLLALAQYLLASDDAALLDEQLPFFHPEGDAKAEHGSVLAHVERALALIDRRVIAGTRLAAYGHGDWNDSLQPADPALAGELCSAWTVTLHYQTLSALAQALRQAGRNALAAALETSLTGVREDFQRLLVADGVVAGLARFRAGGAVEHWLHPSDRETGVRYSLLPMIHAILANLFTPEQASHHVQLIRRHLLAADGARLFDRPFPYRGGLQRNFQRAETSTCFGREIGLMYMHAHLRWAEALAHLGDGEAAFHALRQANPVGLRDTVPNARLRQANCYTSSSDADFADRAEAAARYDAVRTGAVDVEGGWRVYSSGAGIAVRLVRERLLGLRLRRSSLCIDPVLPRSLDGLSARVQLEGRALTLRYRVGPLGHGPRALACNGRPLAIDREAHPYRTGGAVVPMDLLSDGDNVLDIEVG